MYVACDLTLRNSFISVAMGAGKAEKVSLNSIANPKP